MVAQKKFEHIVDKVEQIPRNVIIKQLYGNKDLRRWRKQVCTFCVYFSARNGKKRFACLHWGWMKNMVEWQISRRQFLLPIVFLKIFEAIVESIHYKLPCEIPHWYPDGFQNPRTFGKRPNGSCHFFMLISDYLCLSFSSNLLKAFYSVYHIRL